MLPYIYFFGAKLPMYGLMMLTGGFLAVLFACLRAKKRGLSTMDVLLAAIFCFIFGLIGAKTLYVVTEIPAYITHFKAAGFDFMWLLNEIKRSGIVFYGGLIGGVFGGWLYCRVFRLDFWRYADAMIPFLPLAHGFGRIGCFCAGCCFGCRMDPPWGIPYTNSIGAPNGIPFFPVQLLEAGFCLLLLFPIMQVYSRKQRKPGQVVGLYLVCYGIFRFINEYFRADEIRGIFLGVSTSQWISLLLVPIGILLLTGVLTGFFNKIAVRRLIKSNVITEADDEETGGCAVCTGCGECGRAQDQEGEDDGESPREEDGRPIGSETPSEEK